LHHSIVETVKELGDAYAKLFPFGQKFDDEKKLELQGLWFDTPAPTSGRDNRYFNWFAGFLEKVVGDGYSVGNRFSLADVVLFVRLGDVASNLGQTGEPFQNLEKTNKALSNYPKLVKIVANVAAHPNIQKWLATRGDQAF